jgi:hypothetical protein
LACDWILALYISKSLLAREDIFLEQGSILRDWSIFKSDCTVNLGHKGREYVAPAREKNLFIGNKKQEIVHPKIY